MRKVTDDERHEVAARLRFLTDGYEAISDRAAIVRGELPAPVDDAMWACGLAKAARPTEVFDRLADLIEPSCDRDGLLEMAEELENRSLLVCDRCGCETDAACRTCARWVCSTTARRIRRLCGEWR